MSGGVRIWRLVVRLTAHEVFDARGGFVVFVLVTMVPARVCRLPARSRAGFDYRVAGAADARVMRRRAGGLSVKSRGDVHAAALAFGQR